jgi:hypothetical protein
MNGKRELEASQEQLRTKSSEKKDAPFYSSTHNYIQENPVTQV